MQHSITCINDRKEENQYTEYQQGKDKSFELQTEAEKYNICGVNNGKKCHLCGSSNGLIKKCKKQRNIFFTYNKRRETTER